MGHLRFGGGALFGGGNFNDLRGYPPPRTATGRGRRGVVFYIRICFRRASGLDSNIVTSYMAV